MNFENQKKSKGSHLSWIVFAVATVAIYVLFSSYDFSFILTLSAEIQCFGFGMVFFQIYMTNDVAGVSWNTFCCCGLALAGRLASILVYEVLAFNNIHS